MDYKALAYFFLIIILAVSSLFFFFNSFGKNRKNRLISGKMSLVIAVILLAVTIFAAINFTQKVYKKMKSTIVSLKNFPETIETESSDTTDYVKALRKYEPEKYIGKVPEQYYTYYGFRDWWRFPLVYPYSVYCIDSRDKGVIADDTGRINYDEGGEVNNVTPELDSLIFDSNYLAGETVQEKNKISEQYLIFDFSTGRTQMIKSFELLQKKLNEINFKGSRKLISVKDYSERF